MQIYLDMQNIYIYTLRYPDEDAENWENVRTYYVSGFSYFFQFWKRPC